MIPINYLSRQEAAAIIAAAKFAGMPDQPAVTEARLNGIDAVDGGAIDKAIAEIWRAVDKDALDVYAHGPGDRWFRMSGSETDDVPLLRSPRGGGFTFLRPGNPFHEKLTSQFGPRLNLVSLIFSKLQVEKLARLVRRRRRRVIAIGATNRKSGRPGVQDQIRPIVRQLIEADQWNPTKTLKDLATSVWRSGKMDSPPSEDTVTRVLDALYEDTKERRFERVRRSNRSAQPA
jgi:hypothetical protein